MIARAALMAATALLSLPALAETRVVGGQSVPWESYPAVLAIDYIGGPSCTATRVSADWALTAAHCVEGKPSYSLSARDMTGARVGVDQIQMHPDFQTGSYVNDIALVRLASPLAGPAVALGRNEIAPGTEVAIVGFGRTTANGAMSATLQRGRQHVIGRAACSAAMSGLPVDQGRVCAGTGADASGCPGDSGGPLFDQAGRQIGVTSLVRVGCPQGSPTVYASVPTYRAWIERTVWGAEARGGWYVSPAHPAQGWAVQFDGSAAFLGWFGHGAGGPAWTVARLTRNASGVYEGPVTACPAGAASCGEGGTVTLVPTAEGLRVGGVALAPFQF